MPPLSEAAECRASMVCLADTTLPAAAAATDAAVNRQLQQRPHQLPEATRRKVSVWMTSGSIKNPGRTAVSAPHLATGNRALAVAATAVGERFGHQAERRIVGGVAWRRLRRRLVMKACNQAAGWHEQWGYEALSAQRRMPAAACCHAAARLRRVVASCAAWQLASCNRALEAGQAG